MKVIWSNEATDDLAAIHDYFANDSPEYATKTVKRILQRARQIANFPFSGRMVPELNNQDIRELIEGSYRIIYVTLPQEVRVLTVYHTSRKPPWEPD